MHGGRGAREYRNITHGWRIPRARSKQEGSRNGFRAPIPPFGYCTRTEARLWSGPFVGRAREAEEGEEQCEKLNGLDRASIQLCNFYISFLLSQFILDDLHYTMPVLLIRSIISPSQQLDQL